MTAKPNLEVVKRLRKETNAGLLYCTRAASETNNNFDEAVKWIQENGYFGNGIPPVIVQGKDLDEIPDSPLFQMCIPPCDDCGE